MDVLAVVMMLSGSLYMSIPLTAIGGIFYEAHLNNNKEALDKVKKDGVKRSIAKLREENAAEDSIDKVDTLVHVRAAKHLDTLYKGLHLKLNTIIEDLRTPHANPDVLDFQVLKTLIKGGGKVNGKRAKKPQVSKYLTATFVCADEVVALGTKSLDVLLDMANFSREQNYNLFSLVDLINSDD